MKPKDPQPTPPKWLDKLLEWFCAPHLLEEVQGDLHERYQLRVRKSGTCTWAIWFGYLYCRTLKSENKEEAISLSLL